MGHLSSALSEVLRALEWNKNKLSRDSGVTASQVTRACRGSIAIGADTLRAFVEAMPERCAGYLIAAWLRDQVEQVNPALLESVEIISRSSITTGAKSTLELPAGLDSATRELIVWLAEQAMRHTSVRDMLLNLQRAIGVVTVPQVDIRERDVPVTKRSSVGNESADGTVTDRAQRAAAGLAALAAENPATLAMMEEHLRLAGDPVKKAVNPRKA